MENITKCFGKVTANKDVTLELYKGEILSLLGENGSGKTTLMNMLSGIYFPDEGQIYIDGKPVTIASPKDAFALGIGMIHQHFKLVDVFTAAENIVLGLREKEKFDKRAIARRVREISERYGFDIDPNTMINTMVKRLHEYKRQALKILSVIADYADIKSGKVSADDIMPRTIVFGAKAAPGYYLAKQTIQLINNVARVINNDPDVKGKLNVYFPWNYNIELAMNLIPATDLDEQISQAGKEASGTGNMKFALNGALTVGTLDGANVEIRERVGAENFFLFGMTEPEVSALYAKGYDTKGLSREYYEKDPQLKAAIDMVADGTFSDGDKDTYKDLVNDWLNKDYFMTLADFRAYMDIQAQIEETYRDPMKWSRMAVLNVANSGYFSSDRSIEDYLERIWHTGPLK